MSVGMARPQFGESFGPPPGHHPGHQAMAGPYGQPQQQFGMQMGGQPGDELNLSQLQQLQQHAAARHHHHHHHQQQQQQQQRQHQMAAEMQYQEQQGQGGDGDAAGILETVSLEGILPGIGTSPPMAKAVAATPAASSPVGGGSLSPLPAAIKPPGAAVGLSPGSPSDVVVSTLPAELGIDLPALLQPGTEHPLTTYNTAIHGCANSK